MAIGGILAGGLGTRMGGKIPKQFLKIDGVPIIIRTVRRFMATECIEKCYVAMNKEWIAYCEEMFAEYGIDKERVQIIQGGDTRFGSLVNLANACEKEDEILVTHDCARPFVTEQMIQESVKACARYDMSTVSVPTIDTVLYSSEDHCTSESVPQRDRVFLDQGPQAFPVKRFMELANALTEEEKERYMEAGRLFLDKGLSVAIVEGSRFNFKITTDFDLDFAEFLIGAGKIK